jgi:glucose/arabinose dehydrogenase
VLVAAVALAGGCGGSHGPSVYATGPVHASAFALDPGGALWVSAAGGTDHRGDGVYVIRDGRPVKVLAATEPLGLLWHGGELYVASDGRVDAYSGLRGNRFGRHRVVLREPAGHGSNDGLAALPDGRIALGISAACDHCALTSMWSGGIVSFGPGGRDARVYAAHIRAPYGLAVDGDALLASFNQRDDLGARTPGDWLTLVHQGDDWRYPECYGQCADVPKPIAALDPHAAAGAVVRDGGAALVSEWATGRVLRVDLRTHAVTVFFTGARSPLPLVHVPGAILVGDWRSGRIYRVAT